GGSSTISTAVTSGSAQSVSLSASGQPAGTTVGFAPSTVTAGGSSTMTVAVGASTAAGSYTITVTGAGAGATHTTSVTLTVTPSSSDFSLTASPSSLSVAQGGSGSSTISTAVTSGSVQSVSLSGWTTGGGFSPRAVTTAHGGAYAAQLGSTSAFIGDSTLTQAVAIPSGSSRLTFWYQPHCPDTITYDQIQMQIRSTSGAT